MDRNPADFMKKDSYTQKLKEKYGSMMTAFPDIPKKKLMLLLSILMKAMLTDYPFLDLGFTYFNSCISTNFL